MSHRTGEMTRVALQGEPGALCEEAVRVLSGRGVEPVARRQFTHAVGAGAADRTRPRPASPLP